MFVVLHVPQLLLRPEGNLGECLCGFQGLDLIHQLWPVSFVFLFSYFFVFHDAKDKVVGSPHLIYWVI